MAWVFVGATASCAPENTPGFGQPESDGTTAQPVQNGVVVSDGFEDIVRVEWRHRTCFDCLGNPVDGPDGSCKSSCTGTLLRNDVVLTAKHCVTEDGSREGTPVPPSDVAVHVANGAEEPARASEIVVHPEEDIDVALVALERPLAVRGSVHGHGRAIYPYDPAHHVDDPLWIAGYGLTEAQACGPIDGMLRGGMATLVDVESNKNLAGAKQLLKWGVGAYRQVQHKGDSGSAAFSELSHPPAALGVLNTCEFILNLHLGTCYGASPDDYRHWVDTSLAERTRDVVDSFRVAPGDRYESVTPAPRCGGGDDWSWDGGLGVMQKRPNGACGPGRGGAILLRRAEVYQDAVVSFRVRSAVASGQDASVGVIFRYVDPDHYYQLLFDEAEDAVRLMRKEGEEWTDIEALAWSIDWNAERRLSAFVVGHRAFVYYDDEYVGVVSDSRYPVGRAGMMAGFQTRLLVDDFRAQALRPADAGYWPVPEGQ